MLLAYLPDSCPENTFFFFLLRLSGNKATLCPVVFSDRKTLLLSFRIACYTNVLGKSPGIKTGTRLVEMTQ